VVALLKSGKYPKFLQILYPISLLPLTGKVFEKVTLEIVQRHVGGRNLLNASQFGFHARHSPTLQCVRLADHVTLNFNKKCLRLWYFWILKRPLTLHGTWLGGGGGRTESDISTRVNHIKSNPSFTSILPMYSFLRVFFYSSLTDVQKKCSTLSRGLPCTIWYRGSISPLSATHYNQHSLLWQW
jgi:hypothetical protein